VISVTLFNVALFALLAVMVIRGRRAVRRRMGILLASERGEDQQRYARERARHQRQVRRGQLRQENGLGVEVTPRPPRPISGARPMRRRLVRAMRKRGHDVA
jgi:hypothetical protein